MNKNEIYETVIEDVTLDGNGVCHIGGLAVFVPRTAIGDRLRVRIVKVRSHFAYGRAEEILSPSADRGENLRCINHQCGGCVFGHMDYNVEVQIKEKAVRDCFMRIGGIERTDLFLPAVPCASPFRYRNKAQYPFFIDQSGRANIGFYARRSHRPVSLTKCDCVLQPAEFAQIAEQVLSLVRSKALSIYDEECHKGELRHLYLRRGFHSKQIMVCFVVRSRRYSKELQEISQRLMEENKQIVSCMLNVNPDKTNVILGQRTERLCGRDTIEDTLCGVPVHLSPESFYQVNTEQAQVLYKIAENFAGFNGEETLLDLYCGAGTIGLSMIGHIKKLIGVEIVPQAIENARDNARKMGAEQKAEFLCADSVQAVHQLQERQVHPDVVIVDPPRKGCDSTVLTAIANFAPQRIVMISCNPSTAARDCAILRQLNYQIEKVQAVDMFPGTGHVECVVLMSKKK